MSDIPRVTVSPVEKSGLALINGHQTDAIAELMLMGATDAALGMGLTRQELIVACWYEAEYGKELFKQHWQMWSRYVQIELGRGELPVDEVPLPPRMMRANDPGE